MQAKLNIHLLNQLPKVLRLTHNEIADAAGISIACWYRIVKDPERITVQQLLAISNGLSIPVRRFFSTGQTDVIGVREDYIVGKDYQECYYDGEAVRQIILKGSSWRKAADTVGMHWTNVAASMTAVSRTPVSRLLALCEAYGKSPFDFIVDPNGTTVKKEGGRNPQGNIKQEVSLLHRQVDELSERVDELKTMFRSLLERHDRLERVISEYLGYRSDGVASEPGPDEDSRR